MGDDPNTSEREAFYDAEIAPALLALARRCEAEGLSIVAVVEWEPGETARTVALQQRSSLGIRIVELAAQARNNVDALIMALMKHGREHGHSSICLAGLGVPAGEPKDIAP